MKALCVIDVQVDYTDRPGKYALPSKTVDSLISNINVLVDQAVALGIPVIYIRHVNSTGIAKFLARTFDDGRAIAGTNGIQLNPRLKIAGDTVFDKGNVSAFSSSAFAGFIKSRGIKQLYLCGLDGCTDINSTVQSAKERGLQVTLMSSAIVSSKPDKWSMMMASLGATGVKNAVLLG